MRTCAVLRTIDDLTVGVVEFVDTDRAVRASGVSMGGSH